MDINTINALVLAYLGDSVYENLVREFLINKKISNVKDLQKQSLLFITATNQSKILQYLLENNVLNEQEIAIVKRARNTKINSHPKSCDILTYKHATALESLFGYLKLTNNLERITTIFEKIKEKINDSNW